MNKLNLQIKSKALEDMEKIADYIAKDNQKAALDLLKFFYTSFSYYLLLLLFFLTNTIMPYYKYF